MGGKRPMSYRDLEIWQIGMDMATEVYKLIPFLPDTERFGMAPQFRRAAVSVPSNIAEGWGRGSQPHLANGIRISRGSACELESQWELAVRLGFVTREQVAKFESLASLFGQKTHAFLATIEKSYVREEVATYNASTD